LLKRNEALKLSAASFEQHEEFYHSIPLSVVNICLVALLKKYDNMSEAM